MVLRETKIICVKLINKIFYAKVSDEKEDPELVEIASNIAELNLQNNNCENTEYREPRADYTTEHAGSSK